jgi:hypothetical protein
MHNKAENKLTKQANVNLRNAVKVLVDARNTYNYEAAKCEEEYNPELAPAHDAFKRAQLDVDVLTREYIAALVSECESE